jgi:hypothetical protein
MKKIYIINIYLKHILILSKLLSGSIGRTCDVTPCNLV